MTPEFLKYWRDTGRQELIAQVAPASINDEQRTVDVIWFTGADIPRYSWEDGPFVLRFDPNGADLSKLNKQAPVCDCHSMNTKDDQLGRVDRAWVDGTDYKATLRFKRSTELTGRRPELDGLWQDIKDGIVSKFSMGTEIFAATEKRDKNGQLQIRTVTSWRPYEISIAPIPADFGTTTLAAEIPPAHQPLSLAANRRRREAEILGLQ